MSAIQLPSNVKKISEQCAVIEYDESIYSAEIINAVAQFMIGKCNTMLTKQDNMIKAELIIESGSSIDPLIYEFNEEVINYKFYNENMEKKFEIRKLILERVLLSVKKESGKDNG